MKIHLLNKPQNQISKKRMNYTEFKRVTDYLDFMLRTGNAGTATDIANKFGISERTLRTYFNQLKDMGVPIEYNSTCKTWRYTRPGKLTLTFIPED